MRGWNELGHMWKLDLLENFAKDIMLAWEWQIKFLRRIKFGVI